MFYTYVIRSEITGRYYVGSTKDTDVRLAQHNRYDHFNKKRTSVEIGILREFQDVK